jgi:hypothetical protein
MVSVVLQLRDMDCCSGKHVRMVKTHIGIRGYSIIIDLNLFMSSTFRASISCSRGAAVMSSWWKIKASSSCEVIVTLECVRWSGMLLCGLSSKYCHAPGTVRGLWGTRVPRAARKGVCFLGPWGALFGRGGCAVPNITKHYFIVCRRVPCLLGIFENTDLLKTGCFTTTPFFPHPLPAA